MSSVVHHRTATVNGMDVFYREAGDPQAPALVLLHGFPTSSHMFRNLIPALADSYRVIAPDMIGYGQSAMPTVDEFDYTFDSLTDVTAALLERLGVERFAVYVHDYGAPIAWRLATRSPRSITAIITQNGNAYTDGFVKAFWDRLFAYAENPTPKNEAPLRAALTLELTRWQYLNGVADPSLVSPDGWTVDQSLLNRAGNDAIQLALFRDYPTNVALYPQLQQYFRDSQVPLLAVWGANDEIFGPDGARAFQRDLPDAEIHLVESGHFALESHLEEITGHIRGFLARVVS
ncbi:alpha/beta fold hydrolase [Streptomyces sp. 35G-GA-8]|uniref:alpha/beta fold hydrolase n=1 Tax=Streptomyces sp. 35G-GA-8 TaxID=2939434 RepID=UPI00201EE546|nr:alpha/beta hydrolase [Streptomyces sp. 35G-GA-8]MCL7375513.1 alpha/beta hydrolase [Streptomyces sp. 35G-GA-8]